MTDASSHPAARHRANVTSGDEPAIDSGLDVFIRLPPRRRGYRPSTMRRCSTGDTSTIVSLRSSPPSSNPCETTGPSWLSNSARSRPRSAVGLWLAVLLRQIERHDRYQHMATNRRCYGSL